MSKRWGRIPVGTLAFAMLLGVAGCSEGPDEAPAGGEPLGGGPAADCLAYDEAVLLAQEIAFDGTLTTGSADGTEVTFEVHAWYRGGDGGTVTLQSGGLLDPDAQALIGTTLQIGERYLISASGGVVWACGYSFTYDAATAADWAELFGG